VNVKLFISVILLLNVPYVFASGEVVDYLSVSEVNSARVGGVLVRYVKTFENECLDVEVISIKSKLKVLQRINFCSFEGRSFSTGFAHAGFQNINFDESGVHLELSITPLEPVGEQIRKCFIPVIDGKLSSLECSEIAAQN
jgi:hypothetical protein